MWVSPSCETNKAAGAWRQKISSTVWDWDNGPFPTSCVPCSFFRSRPAISSTRSTVYLTHYQLSLLQSPWKQPPTCQRDVNSQCVFFRAGPHTPLLSLPLLKSPQSCSSLFTSLPGRWWVPAAKIQNTKFVTWILHQAGETLALWHT